MCGLRTSRAHATINAAIVCEILSLVLAFSMRDQDAMPSSIATANSFRSICSRFASLERRGNEEIKTLRDRKRMRESGTEIGFVSFFNVYRNWMLIDICEQKVNIA